MSKDLTFDKAQRHAFDTLKNNTDFKVNAQLITMPAMLIQEQPLTSANGILTFSFGQDAPQQSPILNNFILGINDVACMYAVQLLIGYGATRNIRQYYSYGLSVDDNVVYNAQMTGKFETNDLISLVDTNTMRSENGTNQSQYDGATLINPQRIFTGRNSRVDLSINMGTVNSLAFTPNAFVSMRVWIALGASSATPVGKN